MLVGATAFATSSATADNTLVVADADSGDRLFEIPVCQGDEVTVSYMHSVQRTPVKDVYVVDGTELRAERSVFHSFGAGLPTEDVERTDDGYVVEGSGSHDELSVVPGEIAQHKLEIGGERYDLVEATDGRIVLSLTDRTVRQAVTPRKNPVDSNRPIELRSGRSERNRKLS